jgi:hypothetical protein
MALEAGLAHHLERVLSVVDEGGARGTRLLDDARRLWGRVRRFISLNLVPPEVDRDALELACYALQLPLRHSKAPTAGRMGQISLRDRAEQAAELVITAAADQANADLIERAARILRELPLRAPELAESKLLADAVNLDDFGVTGLVLQAMHLARQHSGLTPVAEGFEKRRQYGYWEARLKDGFHFEPIRQLARRRLHEAGRVADLLLAELREDQSP